MRRLALLMLVALAAPAAPARAWEDTRLAWGRNDTNWHMGLSFGVSLLGAELLELRGWEPWKAAAASSLAVAGAGVLKEFVIDRSPSASDLMADGIGLGASGLVQFSIHFDWPSLRSKSGTSKSATAKSGNPSPVEPALSPAPSTGP